MSILLAIESSLCGGPTRSAPQSKRQRATESGAHQMMGLTVGPGSLVVVRGMARIDASTPLCRGGRRSIGATHPQNHLDDYLDDQDGAATRSAPPRVLLC